MEYTVQKLKDFEVQITEQSEDVGITILHLTADAKTEARKLDVAIRWQLPCIGVHTTWSPGNYKNKEILPEWGAYESSCATTQAPVFADISYDDRNKQTIACSDGKNRVWMHTGVIEESGCLNCVVRIDIEYEVSHYETDIRVDVRDIPFYQALGDVRLWWEQYDGYLPAEVPKAAYNPVYSTWYSFHQNTEVDAILKECGYFSKLGCKTVIVDDGWHTEHTSRSYAYCGDWEPAPSKIPDMRKFVYAVHEMGMKFMLWYSVPFIGSRSQAYTKFQNKLLRIDRKDADGETYVVDPRYPEVREYLIDLYKQAVIEWGVDGFKLDFVDEFTPSDTYQDGMDYASVYDSVDRLLKDVLATLKGIKPDILIEFRQSYVGPLMRTFGNMFRSFDCPNDSWSNGINTLTLRMLNGNTAVHSDMVVWNYDEPAAMAAFQLTRPFFAVPQISVRWERLSQEQSEMISYYLTLWNEHQYTLMFGKMFYKGYVGNYEFVSAHNNEDEIGVIYTGRTAFVQNAANQIIIINSSMEHMIFLEGLNFEQYSYKICDCCGKEQECENSCMKDMLILYDVPTNGSIILQKKEK